MEQNPHFDVSRETFLDLDKFVDLVKKWNPKINLVSKPSIDEIWERHIWDSWQILALIEQSASTWVDIGSGGGFPGLLVAIHAKHNCPKRKTVLVESDSRKCQFLRTASRELGLNTTIVNERVEKVGPLDAKTMSARALISLDGLLEFASKHLAPDGVLIAPKGVSYQQEIEAARQNWAFECTTHASKTNQDAAILEIGSIKHV